MRVLPSFADPLHFARYEVATLSATLPHRPRRSGLTVYLRHHSADLDMLDKVFLDRAYRFPDPVVTSLQMLGRPIRVLDLGAHIGLFGLYVLQRFPDAWIDSVEL